MPFKKGESGNPRGGSAKLRQRAMIRPNATQQEIDEVMEVLRKQSLAGDTSAASVYFKYLVPAYKPITPPQYPDYDEMINKVKLLELQIEHEMEYRQKLDFLCDKLGYKQ